MAIVGTKNSLILWCGFITSDPYEYRDMGSPEINGRKSMGFLGDGFKHFLFATLFGEDFQSDDHIFQMGWFNHQPVFLYI